MAVVIFRFSSLVCLSFNDCFLGEGGRRGQGARRVFGVGLSVLISGLFFYVSLSISLPLFLSPSLSGSLATPLAYFLLPGRVCLCARTAVLPALSCLCLPAYVLSLIHI